MDAIEQAARNIVERVLTKTRDGGFDYREEGEFIEHEIYRAISSYPRKWYDDSMRYEGVHKAVAKICERTKFESIVPTQDLDGMMTDRELIGHCIHRFKTIAKKYLRSLE
jgi:hypothetical protein